MALTYKRTKTGRVKGDDLTHMLVRIRLLLESKVNADTTAWHIQGGNSSYSVPFRLVMGNHTFPLGLTKGEALRTLESLYTGLELGVKISEMNAQFELVAGKDQWTDR